MTHSFPTRRSSDLVVYVNTIVILDYLLALHFYSGSAIIHVREIPGNLARHLFSCLLRFSGAKLIFNSEAAGRAINIEGMRAVVLNGVGDRKSTRLNSSH